MKISTINNQQNNNQNVNFGAFKITPAEKEATLAQLKNIGIDLFESKKGVFLTPKENGHWSKLLLEEGKAKADKFLQQCVDQATELTLSTLESIIRPVKEAKKGLQDAQAHLQATLREALTSLGIE